MASLFWVGGSNPYDGTTNRFATTSGGSATVALVTSADDVTFDANSPAAAAVTTSAAISAKTVTLAAGFTGSLTMSNSLTTTGAITVTQGTLNTNNQTVSCTVISSSNTNTRTISLGSSAVTCSFAGEALTLTTVTNLTWSSNTATITLSGANASMRSNVSNFNGTNFVYTGGGTMQLSNGGTGINTTGNLTVTGTAVQTDTFSLGSNSHSFNNWAINGNSAVNRVVVLTSTPGTTRTMALGASGTFKTGSSNFDMMDITVTGGAANERDFSASTTVGDRLGNTGVTFPAGVAQTRDSTSGQAWSVAARWTSRVPLPQDDVIINASSGNISTTDVICWGKSVTFSGYTGTLTHTSIIGSTPYCIFGSLTLGSGMSYGTAVNTFYMEFRGRGTHTITSNGKTLPTFSSNGNYYIIAPGGSYTLADALAFNVVVGIGNCSLQVTTGSFDSAGYSMTVGRFISTGSATRSVTFGSSVVSLYVTTATSLLSVASAGLTFSGSSATFTVSQISTAARSIDLQGVTLGTFNYTIAKSNAGLTIISTGTINTFNISDTRLLTVTAGQTLTVINTPTLTGVNNGYVYGPGDSYVASIPDSAATSIANDIDVRVRVSIDDIAKAGGFRIAGKYSSAGQRSWRFYISGGSPVFETSNDGTATAVAANSTQTLTAAGLSSGTTYWLRAARDKTGGTVKFYYAADSTSVPSGASWNQIGTTLSSMSTTATFDSTALTTIGGEQTGTNSNPGRYYRLQVCSNLLDDGSAIQADINLATKTFGVDTFTESSSNAATVTMNGLSVYGDGRLQIVSSSAGTPGYLSKPSGGYLSTDYNVIKDIRMYQALNWYVGANTTLVSGNSGIYTSSTTYTHKQSAANYLGSTSTSITATFPAATTSGNLLVAYTESGNATGGGVTFTAGWTQAVVSTNGGSAYIWYKIADGTETTVTYSQTTARVLTVGVVEYTGFSGTPTLDVTDNSNSGTAVTSLSTTATTGPTNASQPALALAFAGGTSNLAAWVSATNSFIPDFTMGSQGGGNYIHTVAKELTSTAAVETTITWTTSRANVYTGLAVFKNVAAGTVNHNNLMLMGVG